MKKNRLLLAFVFLVSTSYAQHVGNSGLFLIGSYHENLTNKTNYDRIIYLKKMKDAGYNLITGFDYTGGFREKYTNLELIEITQALGMYILVGDKGLVYKSNLTDANYKSVVTSQGYSSYSNSYSAYSTIVSPSFLGYMIDDEPYITRPDPDVGMNLPGDPQLNWDLTHGDLIRSVDGIKGEKTRYIYANLGAFWVTSGDWSVYQNQYLNPYFSNPNTGIYSFDYYRFSLINETNGFWRMISPVPTYFQHLNEYALRVKNARAAGKSAIFLGYGLTTGHYISDNSRHHPQGTVNSLSYEGFVNMGYGAKGIIWFTYALPNSGGGVFYYNSPETSVAVYSSVQQANSYLSNIGNEIAGLNWLGVIHGSGIDPESGESGLTTLTSSGNGVSGLISNTSVPQYAMVAAFDNLVTGRKSLLVFNKSIYGGGVPISFTLAVKGVKRLKVKRMNSYWEWATTSYNPSNNSTEVAVSLQPCEAILIESLDQLNFNGAVARIR